MYWCHGSYIIKEHPKGLLYVECGVCRNVLFTGTPNEVKDAVENVKYPEKIEAKLTLTTPVRTMEMTGIRED